MRKSGNSKFPGRLLTYYKYVKKVRAKPLSFDWVIYNADNVCMVLKNKKKMGKQV